MEKRNKGARKKVVLLLGIALVGILSVCLIRNIYISYSASKSDISLDGLCEGGAVIYDTDGTVYTQLNIKKCATWIPLSDIPEEMMDVNDMIGKSYAQLIVEQFLPESNQKKVLAKALEQKYTEAELQEFYFNTVYLGDGVFGLGSGAKRFMGCEYGVISAESKTLLKDVVTSYLVEKSYDNINVVMEEASMRYEENGYVDGVVKETAERLINTGMDELEAYNQIFSGGLHIYTYMNRDVQEILTQAYEEKSIFTKDTSDYEYIQSAMVIMDKKGCICAVASGNNGDKVCNRAVSKNNKVGSTIKPVSTYALGIENKLIHFSSMIENEQRLIVNAQGEEVFWPSNSDGEYGGTVTVTQALQESKNTVAVAIGEMVGADEMYQFLDETLGYDLESYTNQNSDRQLSSLTLGYFYHGIPLTKLISSYEMFATGGQFYDSSMIKEVKTSSGESIYGDERKAVQALSSDTAYIINRLLYNNVYGEHGIAKKAAIEGVEVLGKTGTVGNDNGQSASRLFVGIAGDYLAGVWIGYDDERSLSLKIYNDPDEIYASIISKLPQSGTGEDMPETVLEKAYCTRSGLLAGAHCMHTELGYYTAENMPDICTQCER